MDASTKGDLSNRLNADTGEARGRVKAFQSGAERVHRAVREGFENFITIAKRIAAMAGENPMSDDGGRGRTAPDSRVARSWSADRHGLASDDRGWLIEPTSAIFRAGLRGA